MTFKSRFPQSQPTEQPPQISTTEGVETVTALEDVVEQPKKGPTTVHGTTEVLDEESEVDIAEIANPTAKLIIGKHKLKYQGEEMTLVAIGSPQETGTAEGRVMLRNFHGADSIHTPASLNLMFIPKKP